MKTHLTILKLKKLFLLCLFLTVSSMGYNQNIIHPLNWKQGETKKLLVRLNGKELANGKVAKDTTTTSECFLSIQAISDTSIFVSFSTTNSLIKLGEYYYKDLSKELTCNQNLKSNFSINKNSRTSIIVDDQAYLKALLDSRTEIIGILKSKVPDQIDLVESQIEEIYNALKEKSESSHLMDILLEAYNTEYSKKDTLTTNNLKSNPFKLQDFNGAIVKTYCKTNKTLKTVDVVSEESYNFGEYKEMISKQVNRVTDAMGNIIKTDDDVNPMNELYKMLEAQLKLMDLDASGKLTTTWKEDSDWPIKLSKVSNLQMKMNNTSNNDVGVIIEILMEIQ